MSALYMTVYILGTKTYQWKADINTVYGKINQLKHKQQMFCILNTWGSNLIFHSKGPI